MESNTRVNTGSRFHQNRTYESAARWVPSFLARNLLPAIATGGNKNEGERDMPGLLTEVTPVSFELIADNFRRYGTQIVERECCRKIGWQIIVSVCECTLPRWREFQIYLKIFRGVFERIHVIWIKFECYLISNKNFSKVERDVKWADFYLLELVFSVYVTCSNIQVT